MMVDVIDDVNLWKIAWNKRLKILKKRKRSPQFI